MASADHVYSHRIYVTGRILDVDGRPAAGVAVNLTFENLSAIPGCFDETPEVTGPRGDYEICRHTHIIPANATVTVRAGGASKRVPVDATIRNAVVDLQLPNASAHDVSGERQFARTFTVEGRAFALLDHETDAEGVKVNVTPIFENVTIDLHVLDRVLASTTAKPDEYGVYRADLDITDVPPTATARATMGHDVSEEAASPTFRRADLELIRDLRLIHGPGANAPGSHSAPWPEWAALLALAIGTLLSRRSR